MPSCAAHGCTHRSDRDRHRVTFHRFPKKDSLRLKWIQATRRANFQPSKSAVLCSNHFTEKDFDRAARLVRLRENVVPSLFVFPLDCKTKAEQKNTLNIFSPFEHLVNIPEKTASALKRKLSERWKKMACLRKKKQKRLFQSKRQLMKKKAELKSVISYLKKHDFLGSDSIDILQTCANGVQDLLKRKTANKSDPAWYSPELWSFALTLHFYSPRAYNYIRKMFDTRLPHTSTISKWYLHKLDDSPGFTNTAFTALKSRAEVGKALDKRTPVALMMDEVALRQHLEWDGNRYQGYIDMGTQLDDDSLPLAKEALTFMVVSINDSWKLPIGYFLIDGMGGEERKNLVNRCLEKLHEVGVTVVSLTLDGAASNIKMLKLLGINIDNPSNVKSSFPHPITRLPVYTCLDAGHMLELVRNTLRAKGSLCFYKDHIKWEFVDSLNKLQECEGLSKSLKTSHKLVAAILSESVATSLDFCLKENSKEFLKCEATVTFFRTFDKLVDILNSRNVKSSIQRTNFEQTQTFLYAAKSYILLLKESQNGGSVVVGNRKTGFLGFLLCIESVIALYEHLVLSGQYDMTYLLTYKCSLDHLELFFIKVRNMGNNNPTVRQFKNAYQKVLTCDIQDVQCDDCFETAPSSNLAMVMNVKKQAPFVEVTLVEPEDSHIEKEASSVEVTLIEPEDTHIAKETPSVEVIVIGPEDTHIEKEDSSVEVIMIEPEDTHVKKEATSVEVIIVDPKNMCVIDHDYSRATV